MKITVRIKKNHIAKGKKKCAGKCPIALALLDAGFEKVAVEGSYNVRAGKLYSRTAKMTELNEYLTYDDQQAIDRFISSFDENGKDSVSPFKFTMKVPKDVLLAAGFRRPEVAA